MLLRFNVWNFVEHPVKFRATAAGGSLADVAARIQDDDLLGESRGDKLIERHAIVLRERLGATAQRFRDENLERAHEAERILRN